VELKCIKNNCRYYFSSDQYFETCQLVSKYILLDKCFGLSEVQNKKEEIACKIAKLTEEYEYLSFLETLVEDNQ
jgi:hypothetical protein